MGVEIKETEVSDEDFEEMKGFVRDYLAASVESEEDGGRMRWYPWHSAEYRFNHILNVVDIAKLEAEQDLHAEAGARIAREYLTAHGDYPESFIEQVCSAVEAHSYQGSLDDLPLEVQCLIEADVLDKVGANGTALMLWRMGYESRTHMDTAEMVDRVVERGEDARERVESDTAESMVHQRLKRTRWFQEWLTMEVAEMAVEDDLDDVATGMGDS